MLWRPSASLDTLKHSALLRRAVHDWMQREKVLEVCTPPLSSHANTDPYVESLLVPDTSDTGANSSGKVRYLHTSPEFAMKRILCAYPETDIYQLATVFRAEEQGTYHVTQFSMLEWYRIDMDHHALMKDAESLLSHIWQTFGLPFPEVQIRSYCQEVHQLLGQWPDQLQGSTILDYFTGQGRSFPEGLESDSGASLDLFIDEFVLPTFGKDCITFFTEYPSSKAALARLGLGANGQFVAERFEVFFGQIELANGFHELADATQQRKRFESELQQRCAIGKRMVPIDENLLAALDVGLPHCSGIAMGIDRLHMVLGEHTQIKNVLVFDDDNA